MPGLYTHTTRAAGTILTAAIYNADHENHITNHITTMIDDYSANVATMQTTTDPGEVGTESLATNLAGEIARLRKLIVEITGKAQWYETPATNIAALNTAVAGSGTTPLSLLFHRIMSG